LQNYYKVLSAAMSFLRDWTDTANRRFQQQAFPHQKKNQKRRATVSFSFSHDGCYRKGAVAVRLRLVRVAGIEIFPHVISRSFCIAGTYCRQRWFVRYARSESLLCKQSRIVICG
jgi:hypothetical protein